MIHEIEGPKIVVDVYKPLIWAAEVGNFIVEKPIHLGCFLREQRLVVLNNLGGGFDGGSLFIVHRPRNHNALFIAWNREAIMLNAFFIFLCDQSFSETAGTTYYSAHVIIDGRPNAFGAIGIGACFHCAAL